MFDIPLLALMFFPVYYCGLSECVIKKLFKIMFKILLKIVYFLLLPSLQLERRPVAGSSGLQLLP